MANNANIKIVTDEFGRVLEVYSDVLFTDVVIEQPGQEARTFEARVHNEHYVWAPVYTLTFGDLETSGISLKDVDESDLANIAFNMVGWESGYADSLDFAYEQVMGKSPYNHEDEE